MYVRIEGVTTTLVEARSKRIRTVEWENGVFLRAIDTHVKERSSSDEVTWPPLCRLVDNDVGGCVTSQKGDGASVANGGYQKMIHKRGKGCWKVKACYRNKYNDCKGPLGGNNFRYSLNLALDTIWQCFIVSCVLKYTTSHAIYNMKKEINTDYNFNQLLINKK